MDFYQPIASQTMADPPEWDLIRQARDVPEGFSHRTDVCVVGSGAGGGVAAAILAEGGHEVLLLEEGPHVRATQLTQREHQMYPLLYRDGGNQMTDDGAVNVLQGRALGGSTLINMADCVDLPAPVLRYWARAFGVTRYSEARVAEAARAVRATLHTSPIQLEAVNRNNRLLLDGGRKLSIEGGPMDNNRVGCVGCGYCLLGCAYNAKQSVGLTWIPRALKTGRCQVQSEARVEGLEVSGDRVTAVVGSVVDPRSSRPVASFRVVADRVILCAGAIHSPLLLSQAGVGGRAVGRHLTLQPQAPVSALFKEEVVLYRGIPQSAALWGQEVISETEGLGGFRLEGVSAGPAMAAVAGGLEVQQVHGQLRHFRQTAGCLVLVPDTPSGRVTREKTGRPRIRYQMTRSHKKTLREGIRTATRAYLEAGAELVALPFAASQPITALSELDQLDRYPIRPASLALISAHPQGTCRMGLDTKTSVVDPALKVHGMKNLHVIDASIFPTSASSHTMIPIMSFAWLAAHELV